MNVILISVIETFGFEAFCKWRIGVKYANSEVSFELCNKYGMQII